MGEKGKNGVKWEKYRRATRAERWSGEGKRAAEPPPPFLPPDYRSACCARPFFFPRTPISPFSPNAEPGPRLMWPQTRERAVDGSIFGLCLLNRVKEFIVVNVL